MTSFDTPQKKRPRVGNLLQVAARPGRFNTLLETRPEVRPSTARQKTFQPRTRRSKLGNSSRPSIFTWAKTRYHPVSGTLK